MVYDRGPGFENKNQTLVIRVKIELRIRTEKDGYNRSNNQGPSFRGIRANNSKMFVAQKVALSFNVNSIVNLAAFSSLFTLLIPALMNADNRRVAGSNLVAWTSNGTG